MRYVSSFYEMFIPVRFCSYSFCYDGVYMKHVNSYDIDKAIVKELVVYDNNNNNIYNIYIIIIMEHLTKIVACKRM